jgi:phosphoribosylanthranilate isomerase
MFVKICGINSRDALTAAVDAGADALGFVFAESVREISPHKAALLCRDLPQTVRRVAVMRHPTSAQLEIVMKEFWPDWLQTDVADFDELSVPPDCTALPVYRDALIKAALPTRWPRRLVFEGAQSGQGQLPDWNLAGRIAEEADLILAGGLSTENLVDAIRRVRPWGVDVSSGVEKAPGIKCPNKIRQFVALARGTEIHG